MPQQIYNEGRVVGYSAYEIYLKQLLTEYPDEVPASERQWLSSTVAMGSSMIVKVPTVTQGRYDHQYVDIYFPADSKLVAANTIIASFFDGDCEFNGSWATRVTDYGTLISNNATASPSGEVGPEDTIPTQNIGEWSPAMRNKLEDYMKIVDGLIIQPGDWEAKVTPPAKDLSPDLHNRPRLRLHVKGPITSNPLILITGLTIRSVVAGTSLLTGSTSTPQPENGDFLGPGVFPWASKVVFSVPTSFIDYFMMNNYDRTLPKVGGSRVAIDDSAVIDMRHTNPGTYYQTNDQASRVTMTVNDYETLGAGISVLTVYSKSSAYPPALYATYVDQSGDNYINPIGIVAPGSVHMFSGATVNILVDYESTYPGTFAINKNSDGTIQVLNSSNQLTSVADQSVANATYTAPANSNAGNTVAKVVTTNTGDKQTLTLSMSTSSSTTNPSQVTISQKPAGTPITLTSANSNDNIPWSALLAALANDQAIDVMGDRLKSAKQTLVKAEGSSANECPYLEFGPENAKKRFYISSTVPTGNDIPIGSIGIGWGIS